MGRGRMLRQVECCTVQVLRFQCTVESGCFQGLGDRFKGLSVAFWLVLPSEPQTNLCCLNTNSTCLS